VPSNLGTAAVLASVGSRDSARVDSLGQFVQELASAVADTADADQWAVAISSVGDTGPAELADLIPDWWLQALDGRRAATHRITLPLRSSRRHLGVLRLESWKPGGFRSDELLAARRAARALAGLLDLLVVDQAATKHESGHSIPLDANLESVA
jgi:hypothetical protein